MTALLALWLPVAGYMAGIFWLSSQSALPGPRSSPTGSITTGCITARRTPAWRWWRARACRRATAGGGAGAVSLGAWTIATVYGVTDEWHQSFVPGRMADPRDLLADGVGAALGLGLVWAWSIIRRSS